MSKRTDQEFLSDIREALQRIRAYAAGMTYESFVVDSKTQDAVIRNLEILGEATKNLSDQLRAKYPIVPWRSMAAARDRLIHHILVQTLMLSGKLPLSSYLKWPISWKV